MFSFYKFSTSKCFLTVHFFPFRGQKGQEIRKKSAIKGTRRPLKTFYRCAFNSVISRLSIWISRFLQRKTKPVDFYMSKLTEHICRHPCITLNSLWPPPAPTLRLAETKVRGAEKRQKHSPFTALLTYPLTPFWIITYCTGLKKKKKGPEPSVSRVHDSGLEPARPDTKPPLKDPLNWRC